MFKFNFEIVNEDLNKANNITENKIQSKENENEKNDELSWLPPKMCEPVLIGMENIHPDYTFEKLINDKKLRFLDTNYIESFLSSSTDSFIKQTLNDHSDLKPAVYEGGLKIWECTWDLIDYLASLEIDFQQKNVLELGCGAGLPAIYLGLRGAKITLQDYVSNVLQITLILFQK